MDITETFYVCIRPPTPRFRETIASVYGRLVQLGWKPDKTWYLAGSRDTERKASLRTVTDSHYSQTGFDKGARSLSLDVGEPADGWVSFGDDGTFFFRVRPFEEIRSILAGVSLHPGTIVFGDLESRIASPEEVDRTDHFLSLQRLKDFGFYWIDQFPSERWKFWCEMRPSASRRKLTSVGDTIVAMMWEHPYWPKHPLMANVEPQLNLLGWARALARNFE